MPELPEVETIARQLDKVLEGKKIVEVEVLRRISFQGEPQELVGRRIEKIDRHAKVVIWHFKDWDKVVMIHLKMTGQLVWRPRQNFQFSKSNFQIVGGHPSEDWVAKLPNNHTRVVVTFDDGSRLFFNDLRVFGWMKIISGAELLALSEKWPPDVIDERFTVEYFSDLLGKSKKAIKLVLMDQEKMGGVGNIYANDALNLAKIHPKREARSLAVEERDGLYQAVRKVIELGIRYGGATYSDYRDTQGLGGKYQEHFLVYDREGERCKNCGGTIKKSKLGGRGTYYCEECQK